MSEPDEDITLLERWRSGDAAAGEALFESHFERVYRFFETKCAPEADELTQATFLACMRAKDQFRGEARFRTYLFTIARNELYQSLRKRQQQGVQVDLEESSIAQLITTPGTKLARNQEHQQLIEAMRKLPVAQQSLLELHYWEEMGIAELAAIFDCPQVTIRTRLHRARAAMRDLIESTAPANALETLETMDQWARSLGRR